MTALPDDWRELRGDDLFSIIRGVTYQKRDARSAPGKGLTAILRATNIQSGEIVLDDLVYVPDKYVTAEQLLRRGDLLIATSSGSRDVVGKAAAASTQAYNLAFGAFCSVARPRPGINAAWLRYFTSSDQYREYVERVALGIHINNFRTQDLARMMVPVAPTREQEIIIRTLDRFFTKSRRSRDELSHIPQLIHRLKQAVLASAFEGDLTSDWRTARGHGCKTWKTQALIDLCRKGRGITYGVIKLGDEVMDGTPCLRTSNVRWLRIETDVVKRISPKLSSEYSRTILKGGEVLVNVRGTLGGVAVTAPHMAGWNVSREIAVVPADSLKIDSAYLAYWIGSDPSQRWLRGMEKGVAYTGINLEDLRKLPVELPSIREQREIVRRVGQAFSRIDVFQDATSRAAALLARLEQAFLGKAFRGELLTDELSGVAA